MADVKQGTDWVEQLVELHVLAENGDADAARRAAEWVAEDPTARALWTSVENDCERLRQPSGQD
ncbi:hypothetical protein GCM10010472_24880 [Pseudonocardia halophobica]|uniref:Uncharacterized protein n=1 Tax=Pseudonocardia halophobica TaxID=29401 RepID=A0A9W6KYY9_9PSEU|nr:hypothetical protein [Pseudonocardia halophobica]GLL09720.1 hypothetical protein GCM10017577_08600 [Pseudonocardia halophobica]